MTDEIVQNPETNGEVNKIVEWLKNHAIEIKTVESQEDQQDLDPLKNIVGVSQVVGLGEATHGSKEFFQMKHRLVKFLVTEMGFDTVAFECPEQQAKKIDYYIKTGEGSDGQLSEGLGYEVWKTQEVLDLIHWLREFNSNSDRQVSFYGCDVNDQTGLSSIERDKRMAENVLGVLKEKPDSKIALWAHNSHVSYADEASFRGLGRNLKDELGDRYMCFGMLFNQGSTNARVGNLVTGEFSNRPNPVSLEPAILGSYEHFFAQTHLPLAVFDLRATKESDLFDSWRSDNYTIREMGWAYDLDRKNNFLNKADLINIFDVIVWIDKVSPSISLTE